MADDHSETQERSVSGEVTQLNAFRFARMAAPMTKRALQFGAGAGTAMGLADAGLDAKKKYDKGDNLGAAMSWRCINRTIIQSFRICCLGNG